MSTHSPTFSVIIPTRNGASTIAATLESLLAQTYPHFNAYVLESGSTDDTLHIAWSYADPRIKVLPAGKALNITENWARALSLDLGEFVTFLGHDDLFYPTYLHEIAVMIEAKPDASLYQTHFDLIDSRGLVIRPCRPIPYTESGEQYLNAIHDFRRDSYATGYVTRFSLYKQIGGIPPLPDLMYADHLLWYKLSAAAYKVCSPNTAFGYRIHDQSLSHVTNLEALYAASVGYIRELASTPYGQIPHNQQRAHRFATKTFNGMMHKRLFALMMAPDKTTLDNFATTRQHLVASARQDRVIHVYDFPSHVYETVARLPMGGLRGMITGLVGHIRQIRAARRESRVKTATDSNKG